MKRTSLGKDFGQFLACLGRFLWKRFAGFFGVLEISKSKLASRLYRQRGKYTRSFIHSGMVLLVIAGVTLGPILIAETNPELEYDVWETAQASTSVFSAVGGQDTGTYTFVSEKPRAEIIEYEVQEGDTISAIADRHGVSVETVVWANDLASVKSKIKAGQALNVPPTTGLIHTVKRGESIYSISKKYDVNPQVIVDWPYNTFVNDETFALAVGQKLVVPDGVMPAPVPVARPSTTIAKIDVGANPGTGQFIWPTSGVISQGYKSWHRAIDIANRSLPGIVAADSGVVTLAGWPTPWAYGNRVVIDHGNGFTTLYGHLSQVYVVTGQRIDRGQLLGKVGSTGRSTGPHLHFEIRHNGALVNPLNYLQ
ncbi:M23 family metallopeptidase [Patescibacteria group bacterium]|nr:M23 family metallopeptidase [Patescibacteria group bacterium]